MPRDWRRQAPWWCCWCWGVNRGGLRPPVAMRSIPPAGGSGELECLVGCILASRRAALPRDWRRQAPWWCCWCWGVNRGGLRPPVAMRSIPPTGGSGELECLVGCILASRRAALPRDWRRQAPWWCCWCWGVNRGGLRPPVAMRSIPPAGGSGELECLIGCILASRRAALPRDWRRQAPMKCRRTRPCYPVSIDQPRVVS